MIVKTLTWPRDSHGLFDYESKNLTKKSLKTQNTVKLVRSGNDIYLYKENEVITNKNEKEILKLILREGNYWIGSSIEPKKDKKDGKPENQEEDWENNEQSIWLVVKSYKAANANKIGYKLTEGDLVKLGRVKFRIKEFRGTPNIANKASTKNDNQTKIEGENALSKEESIRKSSIASMKDSVSGSGATCRICLADSPEPGNPFFSPCNCAGTMKYVHLKCLQKWLKSKLHVKMTNYSTSIYWKSLECELCKKSFSSKGKMLSEFISIDSFEVDGQKFDIVEIERPDCPYIILEILSKDKNITRGVHIIKMESKSNIRLGRGHDSDIRITDISVSRCHALIKLEKGNFYIEDNNSKFGTLVHMRKQLPIVGDFNNLSFQIGRTVVSLQVKRNWKLLPACFSSQPADANTSFEDREESGEDILFEEPPRSNNNVNREQNVNVSIHGNEDNHENQSGQEGAEAEPHEEDDGLSDVSAQAMSDDEIGEEGPAPENVNGQPDANNA